MSAASPVPRFKRRQPWTRDEWIVAWDACPKDAQRYSSSSRDVVEVAYLLGRTPAAVSRAFANLWAASSHGREGLEHYARTCGEVVNEFGEDYHALHRAALNIRTRMVQGALAPRIEIHGEGEPKSPETLAAIAWEVSRETGASRRDFAIYSRRGTFVEGVVLAIAGGVAGAVAKRLVDTIEARVQDWWRGRDGRVLRNSSWDLIRRGRVTTFQVRVVQSYLPSYREGDLGDEQQAKLAEFLSAILGIRPTNRGARTIEAMTTGISRSRRAEMERQIGTTLRGLRPRTEGELDALLRVADASEVKRSIKAGRRRRRNIRPPSRSDDRPAGT